MGFRALVLISTLFSVSLASAQETPAPASTDSSAGGLQSEYLHQAPGGNFELTPKIGVTTLSIEYKNTPTDVTSWSLPLSVEAEYGITDMFSIGAELGYAIGGVNYSDCPSNTTCDDKKSHGVIDPSIRAKLNVPVGAGSIRAGLDYSFSLEDSKYEADGDRNVASGGSTLTPYVGYEISFGRNLLGAKIAYEIMKGDRTEKQESSTGPTSTTKYTGGEDLDLAVFYEFHFPRIVSLGGALEFSDSDETKSGTNGAAKTEDNNSSKIVAFRIYAPFKFNERITLVPTIATGWYDFENDSNIDSSTISQVGVYSRFTF